MYKLDVRQTSYFHPERIGGTHLTLAFGEVPMQSVLAAFTATAASSKAGPTTDGGNRLKCMAVDGAATLTREAQLTGDCAESRRGGACRQRGETLLGARLCSSVSPLIADSHFVGSSGHFFSGAPMWVRLSGVDLDNRLL